MKELTEIDALDIMQSDMKLWEQSDTKPLTNNRVEKSIHLPWGIGKYSIIMEGLTDAGKRRSAVSAYAEHIREVIKDKIDDTRVTDRAAIAAAKHEQDDSGDSPSDVREDRPQRKTPPVQGTSGAHTENVTWNASLRETLSARRIALKEDITNAEANLLFYKRELRMIEAALAADDTSELWATDNQGNDKCILK